MSVQELIGDNLAILSKQEIAAAELLFNAGQTHLLSDWPAKGTSDDDKKRLLAQCAALDITVAGGLQGYSDRARTLLANSKLGVNPYEGFVPKVPEGERLSADGGGLARVQEMEKLGEGENSRLCFVMVAGGLGERLGYNGIKIALPTETTTMTPYIKLYVDSILALQARARAESGDNKITLPFCIMVSGDTEAKTRAILAENNNFGMAEGQLTLVKQELVPALLNNSAHFATASDRWTIETKPHGHGDVHELLYSSGTIKRWVDSGKKWVVFFQDTNGLVFRALPAALGVSVHKKLSVNSFTVPRRPGEAVGAICRLEGKENHMTINVEYNQIVPLMDAAGIKEPDEGFSPFPGNINVLVFEASEYYSVLDKTKGIIAEFVNPKYADAEKTTFKKPTRLECMMQDYPKLLGPESNVGCTQLERWTSFSAVKNNIKDAAGKQKQTGYAESGATGEADMYYCNRKILSYAGVDVDVEGEKQAFEGITVKCGANVVLAPKFGTTLAEVASKCPGKGAIQISRASTLVLDGADVSLESMTLDGALIVKIADGAKCVIKDLVVENKSYQFAPLPEDAPEEIAIRGYTLNRQEAVVVTVTADATLTGCVTAGEYSLSGTTLTKAA